MVHNCELFMWGKRQGVGDLCEQNKPLINMELIISLEHEINYFMKRVPITAVKKHT